MSEMPIDLSLIRPLSSEHEKKRYKWRLRAKQRQRLRLERGRVHLPRQA